MYSLQDVVKMVRDAQPDDTADLVLLAGTVFEQYNYWMYMPQLEDSISSAKDLQLTDSEVIEIILRRLSKSTDELLNLQGFSLLDDTLLSEKIEFLQALQAITQLEDKEFVFRLVEGDSSDLDILAELVGFVSTIDKENVLPMVERIPLLFRENLIAAYGEEKIEIEDTPVDRQAISKVFDVFKQSIKNEQPTFAHQLAQYSSGYGIALETLFELFSQTCAVEAQANSDSYQEVARELYGLCCLSGDYYSKPLEGCRLLSVKMYPDLLMRANFEKEVRQLLLKQVP